MISKYNALIIGAGNIGAFYDKPDSINILTHAHAFSLHHGFNLMGFIDIDYHKAEYASAIWGGRAFHHIEEAIESGSVDIVSVTVPDEFHYEIFKELSLCPIKLVFGEKPLAKTASQAAEIATLYSDCNIQVCINYKRRFVPEFQNIRNNIKSGIYGNYVTGTGYYGKGIIHNGSHLIDLLRFFIGEINDVRAVGRTYDFSNDDPTVAAVLSFECGQPFYLQSAASNLFTIFEIDLIFEKKRVRIRDLGFVIEEYEIRDNSIFSGYREMAQSGQYNTHLGDSLFFSVENIHNYLLKKENILCSLEDSYKTLLTSIRILESHE
jgi:predicted dehydrogenase